MFAAVMMPPVFGAGSGSPERPPTISAFSSSPFRPTRPSPLSSSPVRASSPPHSSHLLSQLDTQSSPIQVSSSAAANANAPAVFSSWFSTSTSHSPQTLESQAQPQSLFGFSNDSIRTKSPTFRFASRPTKPVFRGQQSRDAAQQTRRSLFLRNVRQRADDRSWDRRNFEQELQKLEWWSLEREIRQAKETDAMSILTEQDIEDAADWVESPSSSMPSFFIHSDVHGEDDSHHHLDGGSMYFDHADDDETSDERMVDLLAMEEEAELEALIASMDAPGLEELTLPAQLAPSMQLAENETMPPPHQSDSTLYPDDCDYDSIFAELLSATGKEDTEMGSL